MATHIMGVDIAYECIGNCTYRVHWSAYRDCGGAVAITPNVNFNVISGTNCAAPNPLGNWSNQVTTEVTPICPGIQTQCTNSNATIRGVQEYYRYRDYDICSSNCIYQVTWSDCCRNNAITSGSASEQIFTGQTTINTGINPCNSSPRFSNPPIPYICMGQSFTFNQGAYDLDGDSLAYSLGPCYQANATQVTYGPGYSPTAPIGPSWNLNLDPLTGDLSIIPNPGNLAVGVLCIYVEEYRNGQLIGTVVRDMQITVIDCGPNNLPQTAGVSNVTGGTGSGFNVSTCLGSNLCFDIPIVDLDNGQVVTAWWNQNISGATFSQTGSSVQDTISGTNPSATFCWTPTAIGVYTFLVSMQDNNCPMLGSNQYTFSITVNPPVAVSASSQISCLSVLFGANPTGGQGPFLYSWSGSGGFSATGANPTHTYPGPGTYTYSVTITDANGCNAVANGSLTIQPQVAAQAQASPVSCNGVADGSVTGTASGGTSPYTYLWSGNLNGPSQNNLAAGTYGLTVTDAAGCQSITSVVVTEPPLLQSSATATDPSCSSGSDGTASVTASGGSPGYSYLWSNGQTTAQASGLSAGTATVTVTDQNGCAATASVTLTAPAALSLNSSQTPVACFGGANGSATVTASGGSPGYTYLWGNGQTTATATNLSAGLHTVTVTDAQGCQATSSINVTEPSAISLTVSLNSPTCNGLANGSAALSPSGGTSPYSYLWSNGQQTITATSLAAGPYSVTVTDANGCQDSLSLVLTQPSALSVATSAAAVSCNGGSNGSASAAPAGGTAPYSYAWSNSQGGQSIGNLGAGTYSVTVTDANGCTVIASAQVSEPSAIQLQAAGTGPSCNGGSNGTASVGASGGSPGYSYLWSNGQTTAQASGLSAGTATVTVTDANGCVATASVTLTAPAALILNSTQIPVTCFGGVNGSATVTAGGGTPGYAYVWSNGQTTATATNLSAGLHTVTVTDAQGCQAISSINVTEPSAISLSVSLNSPTCNGLANGSAALSPSGGTSPYSYLWSNGQQTVTATSLVAGPYSVTVTDANGCQDSLSLVLTQPSALSVATSAAAVSCNGGSNGSASAAPTGGTAPYTYAWSNSQGGQSIGNLGAGTYSVTVTDANGCTVIGSAQVSEPSALQLQATGTGPSCNGGSNGTASVTASGGTPGYSYLWSNGQTTAQASGLSAGTATVTVTDQNGCVATASVTLTAPAVLSLSGSSQGPGCNGQPSGSATVAVTGGTPGYSYLWSNGAQTATATGLAAGVYTVQVTDANGCNSSISISVTEPSALSLQLSGQDISCFGERDGTMQAAANGGTGTYAFTWNGSQGGNSATGLGPGWYTVVVTDANGCSLSDSLQLSQPDLLEVSIAGPQRVCLGTRAALQSVVQGGTTSYSYSWTSQPAGFSSANAQAIVTPSTATTYSVSVVDAHGCTASASHSMTVAPLPIAAFDAENTSGCDTVTTRFVNLSQGAVSYIWNFGDGTTSTQENPQHQYGNGTFDVGLVAISSEGCRDSIVQQDLVTVLPTPIANFHTLENISQAILLSQAEIHFVNTSQFASTYFWEFGDGYISAETNPVHSYGEPGSYPVTLYAYNAFGCMDSITKGPVLIIPDGAIFAPTAFSPNADGLNDEFLLKGEGITSYQLVIFNRWGEQVFVSQSINDSWDGKFRGIPSQEGVYVWKLEARINSGKEVSLGGSLTLIR